MYLQLLNKLIEVNTETGEIKAKSGITMTIFKSGNYKLIRINGANYHIHKIVMAFHLGKWPNALVDHINGNTEDNRIANLREATWSENNCNRRMRSDNTLGYKGIFQRKAKGGIVYGWMIKWNGYNTSKSGFATAEEAYKARCEMLPKIHGNFANPG